MKACMSGTFKSKVSAVLKRSDTLNIALPLASACRRRAARYLATSACMHARLAFMQAVASLIYHGSVLYLFLTLLLLQRRRGKCFHIASSLLLCCPYVSFVVVTFLPLPPPRWKLDASQAARQSSHMHACISSVASCASSCASHPTWCL